MKNLLNLIFACIFASFILSCSEDMYTLPENEKLTEVNTTLSRASENLQPVTKISDIQNWTGTGSNSSILAIQWVNAKDITKPQDNEIHFLAWGYYWDSPTPTGMDMVMAIAQKDPRLYVVVGEQWGGIVIKGFAYDGDNDGFIKICKGSTVVLTEENFTNGIYWEEGQSFDGLTPSDPDDLWMGGWMETYATYWLGAEGINVPSQYTYSTELVDQRQLKKNSWDAWTFSTINSAEVNVDPRPDLMKAAPNN
ncbi:hypothetical protein AALK14_10425 [Butyricimonas hominis]|jgi:hypothetical protein|uniref:Uncharacterized protein n=1 Tax=Butyricimonas hominis TaxID=2763032 RepID=A0ABR7CW99_9BACT|nr:MULTISPECIES: hypothetical protein [Butyricimonas]MBC5619615.1 hypothetical protein [Butyricimonas hominis]